MNKEIMSALLKDNNLSQMQIRYSDKGIKKYTLKTLIRVYDIPPLDVDEMKEYYKNNIAESYKNY